MHLQGFTSPPVQLNLGNLTLKRSGGAAAAVAPSKKLPVAEAAASNPLAGMPASLPLPEAASRAASGALSSEGARVLEGTEDTIAEAGAAAVPVLVEDQAAAGKTADKQGKATVGMAKKYGPGFVWGQLNGWYKQTVFDPTASLSAERRGTLSMPDIESCYGNSRNRYTMKVLACLPLTMPHDPARLLILCSTILQRADEESKMFECMQWSSRMSLGCMVRVQDRDQLIDHIEKRPEAMWKIGTIWTFKNEAKVYGSPMFDAVWAAMHPGGGLSDPMPDVISKLRSAPLPRSAPAAAH